MMWAATGLGVSAMVAGGYLAAAFVARRRPPAACPEHGRATDPAAGRATGTATGCGAGWADLSPRLLGLGLVLAGLQASLALAGVLLGQWSALPWYLLLELVTLVVPGAAVVSAAREFLDDRTGPPPVPVEVGPRRLSNV